MRKIRNKKLLKKYIDDYEINNIFSENMEEYMELLYFEKNEFICHEDDEVNYLLFFVKGKAKVYISLKNGKSLLLCFYYPFMVLGDLEFASMKKATSNTEVMEDTYCIGLSLNKVRKKLLKDTLFLNYICKSLGEKLEIASKNGSINLLYPLENRVASYIMATKEDNNRCFRISENLTEISELLGTSYRHLLRTLDKLVKNKILLKENSTYYIVSEIALKELAADIYK